MSDNNIEKFPAIDTKVLEDLRSIMEDEFVEILDIYLEDSLSLMNDIHSGFADTHEQILVAAHTLKSSSNHVGARRLASLAQQMETLAKKQDFKAAALLLDELQEAFAEAHGKLSEIAKNKAYFSATH